MSAAKKKEEAEVERVEGMIYPHEERRVLHRVELPHKSSFSRDNKGQPKLEGGGTKISYGLGNQTISHAEASKLYLNAVDREDKARQVREFWAVVLADWNAMTEPVEK